MNRKKLACSILVLAVAGSMWACGSDDDSGGDGSESGSGGASANAGSGGRANGGAGGAHAGTGSGGAPPAGAGGESGSAGASGSNGGEGGDSTGNAGDTSSNAGQGGEGGAAPVPTLAENCVTVCSGQAALDCSLDNLCISNCTDTPTVTEFPEEYEAMIACQAKHLVATDYACSTSDIPIPVDDTQCETLICKWTCDDATFGDPDVYERCECP